MASDVDICNRALSRLGATRITALTDNTVEGIACNSAYTIIRDEVFRSHPWNSLMARTTVSKDGTDPDFGYDDQYTIPADCVRVVEVFESRLPWVVEGRKLLSNAGSPIEFRYIKRETDTALYDPLLLSAIAARLAMELAEEITQSNTKKERLVKDYDLLMTMARRADGQESSPMPLEEDDWILSRL